MRQSGGQPASHGRITKAGRAHARGMLVEAAWSASKAPGPLRAFYQRVRARRGMQVAAVATARKLAVLCWHLTIRQEDYAFTLPSLIAHKRRKLELRAGAPPVRGRKGRSASYSLKAVRAAERDLAAQSEAAYRTMVATWQPARPAQRKKAAGAARQQEDATHSARRLASAAGLPVPCPALRYAVSCARHQPDATAVLATVKVVRPRAARCGRSTSTPAAGRKIRQLRREQAHAPSPHRHTRLTFSFVV